MIENEFGEVGIDDDLLKKNTRMQADEEIIEMMNGCICCTVRQDLVVVLDKLAKKVDAGLKLDGIVIEPHPPFPRGFEPSGGRAVQGAHSEDGKEVVPLAASDSSRLRLVAQKHALDKGAEQGWMRQRPQLASEAYGHSRKRRAPVRLRRGRLRRDR